MSRLMERVTYSSIIGSSAYFSVPHSVHWACCAWVATFDPFARLLTSAIKSKRCFILQDFQRFSLCLPRVNIAMRRKGQSHCYVYMIYFYCFGTVGSDVLMHVQCVWWIFSTMCLCDATIMLISNFKLSKEEK